MPRSSASANLRNFRLFTAQQKEPLVFVRVKTLIDENLSAKSDSFPLKILSWD